jgi:hypothetical protein
VEPPEITIHTWINPEDITYSQPGSAAANNTQIQFIKADHPSNKQGYNVLVFYPPNPGIRQIGAKAVIYHGGLWHEVHQDCTTKQPYLRDVRFDIHKFGKEDLQTFKSKTHQYLQIIYIQHSPSYCYCDL